MAKDAIELLKNDHRVVEDLFKRTKGESDRIEPLGLQIAQALLVHTEMEEKVFYPALRERAMSKSVKKDAILVKHAFDEHALVKQLLLELSAKRGDEHGMKMVLWKMEKAVLLHVTEEENMLFHDARKLFAPDELMRLGADMEEIKAHRPAA